ncbi:MAG: S8 family serine peptidase [Sandaracinus sp.]
MRWLALISLALLECGPRSHEPSDLPDAAVDATDTRPLDERQAMLDALDRGEPQVVLVVGSESSRSVLRQSLRAHVREADVVLAPTHLPITSLIVRDRATLDAIEATRGVVSVEPERQHRTDAIPSLEQIGQPAAFARGADGRGRAVAVLDTGADYTRVELGACTAPGPSCGVVFARDFAPDDGVAEDPTSRHGTNVSSIIRLIAPSVKIVALDVFTGASASSTNIVAALDWVIANRDSYGIVAVNMSLGYGGFTAACPSDVLAVAVQRVRDAGIVPVIASGNGSLTNAISSPACAPAAVSVGAVDRSDVVAYFSNSASFLTLLAPGTSVDAGGVVMSGTSQATPHVAGSIAALLTAYPSDGVGDLVARLVGTGVAITDSRNGLSFRRISLDAATAGGATSPPPDIAPPTGTLTLASEYARTTALTVTIAASDASGVASMCISASATTCTSFVPFAPSATVTLPTGDGTKTVRVWLRDGAGNTTGTPLTATVVLDTRAPSGGTATAASGIASVTLAAGGMTDAGAGIVSYRAVFSTGTAAPASCATGTALPESASASWSHTGLVNGTTYRYRVCAVDRAGNVAAGLTAQAMAVAELDPPTGTIVIEDDRAWARSTRVSVALTASDASSVTQICLSSTTSCSAWAAFASPTTFTLSTGTGARPVYAWFRDRWGNASSSPASDTILLDAVAPANPVVGVERRDGALALSWPEGTDATSGLAGYVVVRASGTAAPACTGAANVAAASGGVRRHVLDGLTNGSTYAYRVCAIDVAGNVSTGTVGTAIPAPETTPPTPGSIVIAGGAAWTRTSAVSVAVSATDASGVASVCLATTATCTSWVPYATTLSASVGTTAGTRTLNAWFRDIYGNTTATPIFDTIGYDATAPSNPAVVAVARSGAVEISFGPSTDAGSGVVGYVLAWGTGTSAPPCAVAGATTFDAVELRSRSIPATAMIRYRVCARDAVGNVSVGQTGSATPLP